MLLSMFSGLSSDARAESGGNLMFLKSRVVPHLNYYLYIPPSPDPRRRMLVTVHGISRNAREHMASFRSHAETYGVTMLAPLFTKRHFRDYQRLGRKGRGPRADLALIQLLGEVSTLYGLPASSINMFGYSGGGQFVHRFAFAHPHLVSELFLGAPGWYTWPDRRFGYPYGIADTRGLDGIAFDLSAIASLRFTVVVGEHDALRDSELNQSVRVDSLQGHNRIERAQNWVDAMNSIASRHGASGGSSFVPIPRTSHSFHEAVTNGGLDRLLFERLYGNSTTPVAGARQFLEVSP